MKRNTVLLLTSLLLGQAGPSQTLAAAPQILDVDRIVAVVNKDVITWQELSDEIERVTQQLRTNNTQLPPPNILRQKVLEGLVVKRLQLELAKTTGIRVSDEELNESINEIAGKNKLSLEEFRKVLAREGFSFEQFRENIRDEMIIGKLRARQIHQRISITDREVDNMLSTLESRTNTHSEYHLGHILIAVPESSSPDKIQAAQRKAEQVLQQLRSGADFARTAIANSSGQQALSGGDLGWRKAGELPTLFSDLVVHMNTGDVSDLIRSPSGFHIIKLLGARGQKSHVITQTRARHILIKTNELISDRDAENRLQQLHLRLEGGDDFATLARSHSDDKGSAIKGGELGWTSPGDMVPTFEKEMDTLKPGQISKPFKTRFGWHIVKVEERRQYDNTDEFKRSQVRQLIRKRKINEQTEAWLQRLRDEAYVEYLLNDS